MDSYELREWADRVAGARRPTYEQLAAVNVEQQETIDRLEREVTRLTVANRILRGQA